MYILQTNNYDPNQEAHSQFRFEIIKSLLTEKEKEKASSVNMFISISKIMINHCIFYRKHWNNREKWHCVKPYSLPKCRSGSKSTATHCNVYTVRVKHLAKVTHGYFHDIYSSWKGTITFSEVESGQTKILSRKNERSQSTGSQITALRY